MKRLVRNIILWLTIGLLGACCISQVTPIPVTPTVSASKSLHIFSEAETKTLASLKQVDDHPLYVMQFYGEYASRPSSNRIIAREAGPTPNCACSLFCCLARRQSSALWSQLRLGFQPGGICIHRSAGWVCLRFDGRHYLFGIQQSNRFQADGPSN
jgi:hypothetical protein